MPSLRVGVYATGIYIVIIALGMGYAYHLGGNPYGTPEMIIHFWGVELVLTVLTVTVALRYFGWRNAGFGRIAWAQLVWMLPAFTVLGAMLWVLVPQITDPALSAADRHVLQLLFFTTFLIGFSEELMFRGILLRGALAALSPPKAMMLSAAAFSALHVVNGLGGQSLPNMVQQLGFTFLIGFSLAPLALRIGTLWPLILWHWLWNFALFASGHLGVFLPFAFVGIMVQVVVSLWLWFRILQSPR